MKSSVIIRVVFIAIISILLINCSGTPIRFGGIRQFGDSENVDFTKGRSITASGVGFQLFGFIPISMNSRYQSAYDGLLKQADNDYLTNIQIQESWIFAWYGVVYRSTIMATAYPHVLKPSMAEVPAVKQPPSEMPSTEEPPLLYPASPDTGPVKQ